MQYEIVLTTAEDIVSVVDAALAGKDICDIQYISEFADISEQQVQNAIKMAVDMELLYLDSSSQSYKSDSLLSHLLVSARNDLQKATIMRFILEQYKPFKSFKDRYIFTQSIDLACKQLKVLYGMATTYRDIKNTITNIATYAKAMISDGANQFVLNDDQVTYLEILDVVLKSKANDDNALKTLLGESVYNYIDADKVYTPLSDAFSKVQNELTEGKTIILYSGNAFESFLQQIADEHSVSLAGKNGIL